MNRLLKIAVLMIGLGPSFAVATESADIFGEWWTPGFNARVRIEACDERLCGVITWLWDETPTDIADRRPLIGRKIFSDLKGLRANYWAEGKIYNPEDGNFYNASIQLTSADALEVKGCVLFVCRRQVWRRVDRSACPPVHETDF
jgi:uncharacterized protein (DUF2147 family)